MTHPNDALDADIELVQMAIDKMAMQHDQALGNNAELAFRNILAALTQKPPVIEGLDEAILRASRLQITISGKDRHTLVKAARAYQQGHAVPSGWKVVPIVPDRAMIQAAQSMFSETWSTERIYKAMLSAAPTPPQESVDWDAMIYECQHDARWLAIQDKHIEAIIKWVRDYHPEVAATHNISKKGG